MRETRVSESQSVNCLRGLSQDVCDERKRECNAKVCLRMSHKIGWKIWLDCGLGRGRADSECKARPERLGCLFCLIGMTIFGKARPRLALSM